MLSLTKRHHRPRGHHHPRSGFTLIEILVVITIIGILLALLLPAINGVRVRARVAQVRTEIASLESAIATFKTQYGTEPPSSLTIWENPGVAGGWNSFNSGNGPPSAAAVDSRAKIRQLWPQFDFTMVRNINGNASSTEVITLSQGECLVFFLGGIPTTTVVSGKTIFSVTGFSKNPFNPFATGGGRDTAIYEFNTSRFVDIDSDGFPEFLDPLPAQTLPYLYYTSYGGQGYKPAEFGGGGLTEPYRQGTALNAPLWKANGCQIISPGYDHAYGYGGAFVPTGTDPLLIDPTAYTSATPARTPPTSLQRSPEEDNITNFHSGTLAGK